ncbi:aldehyde dehydrogenase family protein [Arthrobacter pigmenti]
MSTQQTLEYPPGANFIDNQWMPSTGPRVNTLNPADSSDVVGVVPDSTSEDVESAILAAQRALPDWAATPAPARGDILRRWSELIGQKIEELAQLMTREMGKPLAESRGELGRARLELDYAAGEGTRLHGTTIPSRLPGLLVYTEREPIGVVGAITPWNFPAVAPMRKIAPALIYGNTVVLKPALETPLTALALAALLRDAGLPNGVLNVVTGRGSAIGAQIAADSRVAGVSFTGSTSVGRQVNLAVAERMGDVQLELGGKNAVYVHSAADLEHVVSEITAAAIQTTGQRCTSISRVIVARDIADEFVQLLSDRWNNLTVGRGTEEGTVVGPLVSDVQFDRVNGYVNQGLQEGAVRVTSDRAVPDGPYFPPTVLDHVTRDMTVAREEIFGPVLSVTRVNTVEEAIEIANDTDYGLAAAVFSEDIDVAMRFSRQANSGMIHINHGTTSQPHVPFGGHKDSGAGAFSIGHTNVEFFTRTKVVYLKPKAAGPEESKRRPDPA